MGMLLEMELGITGGEEDGVNNEDANPEDLYTKPEEVYEVYKAFSEVEGSRFTIAAAFGNVHGVYAPGNVQLDPEILGNSQIYIADKIGAAEGSKPVSFVFHGGSGSDIKDNKKYYDPREALRAGESEQVNRLQQCFADLNCVDVCGLNPAREPSNVLGPRRGGLPS